MEIIELDRVCFYCRHNARYYDRLIEHDVCGDCITDQTQRLFWTVPMRDDLFALEKPPICSRCHTTKNRPLLNARVGSFGRDDDDILFAGWRFCERCQKHFVQSDAEILRLLKVESYPTE